MMNWYDVDYCNLDTPALIIDQEKVQKNINHAITYAGSLSRLRPHVKTHKILEVTMLQLAAGITKYKCATISEAEMLGMAGAKDVLIAYQPQGPKINRVGELINAFPTRKYSVLVDNMKTIVELQSVFVSQKESISVYIDINVGQNRSGIRLPYVLELVEDMIGYTAVSLVGLHCYDGHITMSSLEERIEAGKAAFQSVFRLKRYIDEKYNMSLNIVAGGSPSFSVHARYHDVECSPGTWIFWDEQYSLRYQELPFEKAAILATRVISKIDDYNYCLDLGHKSVASEFPFPRVSFLDGPELVEIGQSEEHLVVKCKISNALEIGQLLLAYPYHICPTVALYDCAQVIIGGKIVGEWKVIARDRRITI